MPVLASVYGGNLGDALWLTPLARYEPDLTVWLRGDDAKACSVAPIFDGLCHVHLAPNPPETCKSPIKDHVTQQILDVYGHRGKPSIPSIVLTSEEILWAIGYISSLTSSRKIIGIVNHCSGSSDPTNYRAHYVRGNPAIFDFLVRFWRGAGYTVLQFGPAPGFYTPDIFTPIPDTIPVRGLNVRQLAAVYYIIGKLITPDTGDQHLALSVGATVICLVPPHSDQLGYRHWDLHYNTICWGNTIPHLRYCLHHHWDRLMNTNLFDGGSDLSPRDTNGALIL